MLQNVVVGLLIGGIPIALFILRTQASLVLLSLFAGATLSQAVGDEILPFVGGLIKLNGVLTNAVHVFMFVLPAMVLALHYRRSTGFKLPLQLVPMLLSGLLALYLLLPLLTVDARAFFTGSPVYQTVAVYSDLVITASVLIPVLVLVASYKKPKGDEHGKKHHK